MCKNSAVRPFDPELILLGNFFGYWLSLIAYHWCVWFFCSPGSILISVRILATARLSALLVCRQFFLLISPQWSCVPMESVVIFPSSDFESSLLFKILFASQLQRVRRRRDRFFHPLIPSPNGYSAGDGQPGAWSLCRDSSIGPSPAPSSGTLAGS